MTASMPCHPSRVPPVRSGDCFISFVVSAFIHALLRACVFVGQMQEDDPRNRKNLRDDDDLARPVQLEPMALPTADHMVPSHRTRACLAPKVLDGWQLVM